MKRCLICGDETKRPIAATLEHLRLYESGNWGWFKGNMRAFGAWSGFWSSVGLVCPLFNTLRHWKYRKVTLAVPGGKPLESAFDANGCAIKRADSDSTEKS